MSTDEEQLTDMNQTTLELHESQLQQLLEQCAAMESRVRDQLTMMESDNKQRLDVLQRDIPTSQSLHQQLEAEIKHQMAALQRQLNTMLFILIILLAMNLSQSDLTRWNHFIRQTPTLVTDDKTEAESVGLKRFIDGIDELKRAFRKKFIANL